MDEELKDFHFLNTPEQGNDMEYQKTVHVRKTSPKTLLENVGNLVQESLAGHFDKDRKTVIKMNGNFDRIYPGSNTSPWFLDAFLSVLRDHGFRNLLVVEGDLMTFRAYDMIRRTGLIHILHKYDTPFIDYEDFPRNEKEIPLLFDTAQVINTPVPHAHGIAKISCATKNLFGVLPVYRRKYHRILSEKLLETNDAMSMYTIVDGTIGLDSESTRRGDPRRLDLLMAGWNNLKIDIIVSWILGYDTPEEIPLLQMALEQNKVDKDIVLAGDFNKKENLPRFNFKFEHSLIRKTAMMLENTFLEDTKSFVWCETQLHKLYHAYSFRKKRTDLFKGDWMDYYKGYEEIINI